MGWQLYDEVKVIRHEAIAWQYPFVMLPSPQKSPYDGLCQFLVIEWASIFSMDANRKEEFAVAPGVAFHWQPMFLAARLLRIVSIQKVD
jgi:hypothetical protein